MEDLTLLLFTLKIDWNIDVTVEKKPKKEMVVWSCVKITVGKIYPLIQLIPFFFQHSASIIRYNKMI